MISRRLFRIVRLLVLGLILTSSVATLDRSGSLLNLEQWTYDTRVRRFQRHFAPPDDGIVHVMIDDVSLEADKIGEWPWPRSRMAALVDEAVRDGAKHLAFDVLLEGPGRPDLTADGKARGGESPDDQLVASIQSAVRAGCRVLLPISLDFIDPAEDKVLRHAIDALEARLSLSPDDLAAQIHVDGAVVRARYYDRAMKEAMARVARAAVADDRLNDDAIIRHALPDTAPDGVIRHTPETQALRRALKLARTVSEIASKATQPQSADDRLLKTHIAATPLDLFARVCTDSGFVDYLRPADGRVRVVPLVAAADGRVVPHFALALAALRLGIDLTDAEQFEAMPDRLVLRPPGGKEISVPVRVADAGDPPQSVGALMDIPLRGNNDFHSLYAPRTDAFVSAFELWRASEGDRKIKVNLSIVAKAVANEISLVDPDDPADSNPPAPDDADAVIAAGQRLLTAAAAHPIRDESPRGQTHRRNVLKAKEALKAIDELRSSTQLYRQRLREKLTGKTALFGWSATGQIADTVPTSLHATCPGVVVHGAIASAILSGELWTHLPPIYATVLTVACGLMTTLAVTFLSPSRALIVSIGLLVFVAGGASVVLFDRLNIVIGLAGPMTAIFVCWASCTLVVTLRERGDRARITRRFRSYVDPALVSYVLDHPESNSLAGESREMTVVFIDVAGFTAMTEKLGGESIRILRQLMDTLVPIIRKNNGFVNKFLGDGVMFFYGAPRHDPDHARHAVRTVIEMQQALERFNTELEDGLPRLGVRAGISTGRMLVGDAGSADACDYTVLGDAVNLASRLEGANKALGTTALATARTAELCGNDFLFIPLGRLIVVGKENPVAVCEPVCEYARATPRQRECAEALGMVWSHLDENRLKEAMAELGKLRAHPERSDFCAMVERWMNELPARPEPAALAIRLTGK